MKYWITLLLLICTSGLAGVVEAAERPNIIFILADDLGYGDLSCFGQKNFSTPHLDQLATEGMRLTSHYSGSTVCAPSRACLHTGLHTGHVYQRINGKVQLRDDPQDTILARLLNDSGYHTALIGKSGLSCNSSDGGLPNRKGFEHFFGYTSHSAAHRYYPPWLWRNGAKVPHPENKGKEGTQYPGELFLAEALQYLDEHQEDPFYLQLSLQQPHADLSVPVEWKQPFLEKFDDKPFAGGHYRAERHPKATFVGMVTYLDHSVGKVIEKLKELGIAENTLVIFSSDNGPMSEGGWDKDHFNSGGPLRGGKRDLYEGGVRVPTIAWWPGKIDAATQSDHASAFWDFLPTACEVAGVDMPEGLDGISYLPTLLGEDEKQQEHEYLYWEFYERGGKQAIRAGKWKGVRLNVREERYGNLELYNLEADLSESNDLADEHPEVAEHLAELMEQAHEESEIIRFSEARR